MDQDYYPVLSSVVMASARHDPQLRQRLYELARSKLRRRLDWEAYELGPAGRARQMQALEAAIEQIEADLGGNANRRLRPAATLAAADAQPLVEIIPPGQYVPLPPPAPPPQSDSRPAAPARVSAGRSAALLFAAALLGVAAYVAVQRGVYDRPANEANADRSLVTSALSKPVPGVPIPDAYGVYAIAGGRLTELEPLSIRVPSLGVPISAAFSDASKTTLPSGRVQFIAFRRDLVGNVPDRVVVRVVARVMRPPTTRSLPAAPAGDGWVIRNLAHEMKVGPVEGRPAMIVMRPADAELSLPAGRYALVLKGSAYDFTVDGPVTDLAQCIERSDEVDAPVYAPCHSRP
jgi:hypothetical protein